MTIFRLIPRSELPSRWPRLAELLASAVAMGNGELVVDDILDRALEGRMFIFADDDFAVTTEFIRYPRKTVMVVGFGAGKVPDRKHVAATLTAAAKTVGAASIQTYCKNPAMARYYRRWFGLKPLYTVLETPL
jgi:hypothetical protein